MPSRSTRRDRRRMRRPHNSRIDLATDRRRQRSAPRTRGFVDYERVAVRYQEGRSLPAEVLERWGSAVGPSEVIARDAVAASPRRRRMRPGSRSGDAPNALPGRRYLGNCSRRSWDEPLDGDTSPVQRRASPEGAGTLTRRRRSSVVDANGERPLVAQIGGPIQQRVVPCGRLIQSGLRDLAL